MDFPLDENNEVEFDILETALTNEGLRLRQMGHREDAELADAMVARLDMLRMGL